jgi:GDPmannose 4,6-dehydratase
MTDSLNLTSIIQSVQPDEIYNLAAQSHVKVSFEIPEYTANTDATGTLRLLEAVRLLGLAKKTRIYQASTSELFGLVQQIPQTEKTPFYPRSPYAVAKLYGYWITVNYREEYDMYACNGILFNHESPVRGETFVTRKITRAIAAIVTGKQNELFLGNLDAKRDWGHAKDYIKVMWLMLQQEKPEDFVIATGKTTTIRDFVRMACNVSGIEIEFSGKGISETGTIKNIDNNKFLNVVGHEYADVLNTLIDKTIVRIDPEYFRPTEVDLLIGDATKAREKLDWQPQYTLDQMIEEMIFFDIKEAKKK